MEEHNGAGNLTPDEAVEQARQEAEAKGETLSRVDEAKIRAKATVSQQSADEEAVTEEEAAERGGDLTDGCTEKFGYVYEMSVHG